MPRISTMTAPLAWLAVVVGMASAQTTPPNVVLIMVDDMAWSALSVAMDASEPLSKSDFHQTPRLEEMAARGMTFSNGYASGPICSPTRAALMTGISPAQLQVTDLRQAASRTNGRFGAYYEGRELNPPPPESTEFPNEKTIFGQVNDLGNGYRTSWAGKYDWAPRPTDIGVDNWIRTSLTQEDPVSIDRLTDQTLDFIEQEVAADRPFFSVIAHAAVKTIGARPETIAKYQNLPPGERHFDPVYAAMHEELDASIGRVFDKIDDLGVADNTYVFFTADHGAPISIAQLAKANEPLFSGKGTLWEGGVRVPVLAMGPGIPGGSRSDVPINTTDITATLYDIAGGEGMADPRAEGVSLLPLMENGGQLPGGEPLGRQFAPDGELFWHYPHYTGRLPSGVTRPSSAVRVGDYKLVREYGWEGEPDRLFLFNLADSLQESSDIDSPLNLASQMPELTESLNARLDRYLEAVDASLPYEVTTPISMEWRADMATADGWQSVEDVDFFLRETMRWTGNPAELVPASPFQPGLSKISAEFDGVRTARRRFFHVGDRQRDRNHSAAFQLWVKLDNLDNEQVLFEAGDAGQGLSLSLGDADGDGSHDDLRFRLLVGNSGEALTVTAPLGVYADATQDFVQLSAVVNDTVGDRYIELFINGRSVGRTAGIGVLDWDNTDFARIGARIEDPASIGAASGSGDPAFIGGRIVGSVTNFHFRNRFMTPLEVQQSFAERLTHPAFGLTTLTGDAASPGLRPVGVAQGQWEQDGALQVVHERIDTLDESLTVDAAAVADGSVVVDGVAATLGLVMEAGSLVSSYLVHYDAATVAGAEATLSGTLRFAAPIVGLIFDQGSLAASDLLLGAGVEFSLADRAIDLAGSGVFGFSSDLRGLTFNLNVDADSLVEFRVITATPTPGDFNGDGVVSLDDYQLWKSEFGASGASLADGNLDGVVDAADFSVWRDAFSAAGGAGLVGPEPGAAVVLAASLMAVSLTRLRPRRRRW
ncbi:MAG: sulfatase-like hydrolase/transferase [Planctomycetota bacterium]